MNYFILDIETKPDKELIKLFEESIKPDPRLKDPVKIEADIEKKKAEARKKMSLDQDFSEIVCVGVRAVGIDSVVYSLEDMTKVFKTIIAPSTSIVTFNGKSFDIPILIKNGIKKGLDFPYRQLARMTEKYRADNHIDLMQVLDFNSNSYKSLNHYLSVYLGVRKETMGDDFFATATQEEIEQHCLDDLIYTEMLFEKFRDMI